MPRRLLPSKVQRDCIQHQCVHHLSSRTLLRSFGLHMESHLPRRHILSSWVYVPLPLPGWSLLPEKNACTSVVPKWILLSSTFRIPVALLEWNVLPSKNGDPIAVPQRLQFQERYRPASGSRRFVSQLPAGYLFNQHSLLRVVLTWIRLPRWNSNTNTFQSFNGPRISLPRGTLLHGWK